MKSAGIPVFQPYTSEGGISGLNFFTWLQGDNHYSESFHQNDYDEVLFFKEGNGKTEFTNSQHIIQPCSIHFIVKGQTHRLSVINGSGYSLLFSDGMCNSYLSEKIVSSLPFNIGLALCPVLNLTISKFNTVVALLKNVHDTVLQKTVCRQNETTNSLNLLFSFIQFHYTNNNAVYLPKAKSKIVTEYLQTVETHYMKHFSVHQYADILCTVPNYLNELCKKELGITAQQVIKNKFINHAKHLLADSTLEIKEVAFELGFCDAAHFSHFFKKYTGYTPKVFQHKL